MNGRILLNGICHKISQLIVFLLHLIAFSLKKTENKTRDISGEMHFFLLLHNHHKFMRS